MRGVADQRHARRDHRMRMDQHQREGFHHFRLQRAQLAQLRAGQRCQSLRQLRLSLAQQGLGQCIRRRPHQRHALPRQWQQRDDALARSEPLIGSAVMRLVALEIGDHRALSVRPVIDADFALPAHPGLAAIGAHQ